MNYVQGLYDYSCLYLFVTKGSVRGKVHTSLVELFHAVVEQGSVMLCDAVRCCVRVVTSFLVL